MGLTARKVLLRCAVYFFPAGKMLQDDSNKEAVLLLEWFRKVEWLFLEMKSDDMPRQLEDCAGAVNEKCH